MGKLSLFNKQTQENYNAKMAQEIQSGTAVFLRPIKSWELLSPTKVAKFTKGKTS